MTSRKKEPEKKQREKPAQVTERNDEPDEIDKKTFIEQEHKSPDDLELTEVYPEE